jgi:hypothetical protein
MAEELFYSARGAGPFDTGQWGVVNGISATIFNRNVLWSAVTIAGHYRTNP